MMCVFLQELILLVSVYDISRIPGSVTSTEYIHPWIFVKDSVVALAVCMLFSIVWSVYGYKMYNKDIFLPG